MKPLIHEPAMQKIINSKAASWVKALRELAHTAEEANASTAAATFSWLEDSEIVDARYLPEITLRVREIH